jgi:hypothetical protein
MISPGVRITSPGWPSQKIDRCVWLPVTGMMSGWPTLPWAHFIDVVTLPVTPLLPRLIHRTTMLDDSDTSRIAGMAPDSAGRATV